MRKKYFIFSLLLVSPTINTPAIAAEAPSIASNWSPSDSISTKGNKSDSWAIDLAKGSFSKKTVASHEIAVHPGYSSAIAKLNLQPSRNNEDSTEPRLTYDGRGTRQGGKSIAGGATTNTQCVTNNGKGAAGNLQPIALPLGDIEGTGSFATDLVGNFACIPAKATAGEPIVIIDEETGEEIEIEPIIITVTTEQFEDQPIEPAVLMMDRAPHSLKNYNTNVYANSEEQIFHENIMGENVEIKAIPVSYTFDFGDGTTLTTSNGGYSVGEEWDVETPTSHRYAQTGTYQYSVTTTFRGEFRVPGGPWQVIPGTAIRTSVPQEVQVWRVTAGNVQDSCAKNSSSYGC